MKRVLKIVVCLALTLTTLCFTMGGFCKSLYFDYEPPEVEWDGRFLYHIHAGSCYILGTEPELGVKSEVLDKLYLPSHYKGCRILDVQLTEVGYVESLDRVENYTFGIDITPVKEIYYPYSLATNDFLGTINCYKVVMTMIDCAYAGAQYETTAGTLSVYVPNIAFMRACIAVKNVNATIISESNFEVCFTRRDESQVRYVCKANTAYMFNYEGSPNEDYYFINDFKRGGLIENTPYEPYREGYTFTGWYKDSECTQKWDFGVDTLPEPTYDENGELEYVETRLYAGWNKI